MDSLKKFLNSFSSISEKTWETIKPLFTEKHIKKNEYFVKDRQTAQTIGFLESGIFRAFYRNELGKEYNNQIFSSPSFIGGYSSLISNRKNQINQQALTDSLVYIANFEKFTALYKTFPDLEIIARKWAEKKFILMEQREIDLVCLTADKRYELLIKQLPEIEQLVPQYHIASHLGVTATQLSRIKRQRATSK